MTTGLGHLRARDYDPLRGRFTSRDTLSPNGSGTKGYDPYGYAQGNPATLTDPTGHSPEVLATLVGAMVSLYKVMAILQLLPPAAQGLVRSLVMLGMVLVRMLVVLYLYAEAVRETPILASPVGGAMMYLGLRKLFRPVEEWGKRCIANPNACLGLPYDFPRLPDVCNKLCETAREWVFEQSNTFGMCVLASVQISLGKRLGGAGAATTCFVIDKQENGGIASSVAAGPSAVVAGFTPFSASASLTTGYLFSNATTIFDLEGSSVTFDGAVGGRVGT